MNNLAIQYKLLQEYEKRRCEKSLAQFVRSSWHIIEPSTELVWNWHLDTLCGYLEALHEGLIRNLIINVPPGSMKSIVVSVCFPAWIWIEEKGVRFLGVTNEQGLALRDALKAKTILESEWYQSKWSFDFDKRQNEKSLYQNTELGFRQSIGITSNATGKRGDYILIDDPNDAKKVESDAIRTDINDSYDVKISNRVNDPKNSKRLLISQRVHEEDLSGHLLEKDGWVHLCIPMEYEENYPYQFDAGEDIGRPELNDPRTEEGELFFEERFSREVVDEMKGVLGPYAAPGQLQQRPAPKGGGLFKDKYWKYYDELPLNISNMIIYVDTAQKTKEQNDYTVAQCWALSPGNGIYLVDQIRGKWEAPELKTNIQAFWNKHKPTRLKPMGVKKMKVEDKVSGTGLIQEIKKDKKIPVDAVQRNIDKVVRVLGVIPRIAAGNVYLPKDAEWLSDYLEEFRKFTALMTHKHDDQIDCTVDAIEDLLVFHNDNLGDLLKMAMRKKK